MNILTVVYGDKYIEMMRRGLLRSLSFRGNKRVLYDSHSIWNIFTEEKYFFELEKMLYAYLPELKVEMRPTSCLRDHVDAAQSAILKMIKKCLDEKSGFLMAPPDTIFGDGSLLGMAKMMKKPGDCVAVAHPRVLPEILDHSFETAISNKELCGLAWKHLHRAWSEAERDHMNQNSFMGGVEWEWANKKEVKVTHRLPTIYMCDFVKEDLDYFTFVPGFGHYDHQWPSILVEMGRQKYVRDSDQAFIVEITEANKNVPPLVPGQKRGFWKNDPHNEINAKTPITFRMD